MGAKDLGAAASGPKRGGVSRKSFDEQMHQDQEMEGLFEIWKNAVRRTCLHYVAYADAREGMDGMKEARQFREFRVRLRTEQAVRHLTHRIYASAASFPPAIPEKDGEKVLRISQVKAATSPSFAGVPPFADQKGRFQGATQNFEGLLLEMRTVARSARTKVRLKIMGLKREAKLFKKEHDSSMPKLAKVGYTP